jgi:transcriptional regulator GlxA family with amidase domain
MAQRALIPAKRIGLIGFDGVAAIDLVGVLDAFSIANWRETPARYETATIAATDAPFRAESGLRLLPDTTFEHAPAFDTLIVPGGPGLRRAEILAPVADWLKSRAGETRRMVSVCTGLYGLAAAGVMDGRRATTHWRHAAAFARRFPAVKLEPDAIFIKDGPFYTSAGMTAGIDLALALIEEDHGPAHALNVARQMVVYMKRSGGQLQYSEPLRSQTRAGDRFADLVARMVGDLSADWSVEIMAAEIGLSPRQFTRRFKAAFDTSPGAYLDALRLDEARLRLASGRDGIARIAHAVGFSSDDAFRRAFERRFGVTPTAYRSRFAPAPPPQSDPETDDETPLRL